MNRKTNLKIRVVILVLAVAVFNVTYVYGQAQPDYPSDGAVISGDVALENIWTRLIFIPDASAVKHTGYFSDDYNDVAGRVQDANLGEPPYGHIPGWEYTFFAGNPQVPPADETLVRGTKYYWTVDETDALGNTLAGDVWEFIIQDFKASSPNPHNEAIFVETDVLLSWAPGFGVEEHDVYLGTDFNSVELAEFDFTVPPPEFVGTTSEASILVTGLTQGVKYYWRVDEVVGRGPPLFIPTEFYKGDVWCFTTIPEGVGSIREDLWWGIAGDDVNDLLNDPRYPGNPDEIRMLTSFDSGVGLAGDEYGGQIHGWLHPAKSGDYTFWLCSDDSSELFLSTDHTPANKVRIAYIDGWAEWPYDWYNQGGTDNPNQQSSSISLVGGQKYYIMARWKESFGYDFCMVAWQGPDQPLAPVDGSASAVIPGNRLSPFVQLWAHDPDPCDGQVSVESPVTLRWGPGDNAAEHDVYVGTDKALVESRSPSVYKGRIDSNSYNLGSVLSGMIYYWAIDEVSDFGPSPGIWQGDVWSFTTKPAPIFVDDDAAGANDGSSWADAYNSLQDGLARANSSVKPVEIQVAQGVYKPGTALPTPPPPPPGAPPLPPPSFDRTATFQLINNVTVNGGYAGFGEPDPNARDIDAYETILSGDLAGNDVDVSDPCDLLDELSRGENSYHVVTGSGTDAKAVLDGFTITAGNANQLGPPQPPPPSANYYPPTPIGHGGGMFNHSGNPTVANCKFILNMANDRGGGMCNEDESSPTLTNCIFNRNSASRGGGMYTEESSPNLVNCTFNGNLATGFGGGMHNWKSSPTLTNCTFIGNSTSDGIFNEGGGMYNYSSSTNITNCTFIGNSAYFSGGAVCIVGISTSTITNCMFIDNSAKYGGGAMYIRHCNPMLINCTFRNNKIEAGSGGGIMCSSEASPTLISCEFLGNVALSGGGMHNSLSSSPTLLNCTFTGNSASNVGGGIIVFSSSLTLVNCTFSGNWSGSYGGGIYSKGSDTTLSNCVLCGDTSIEVSEIYLAKFIDYKGIEYPSIMNVDYTDICGWDTNIYVGTDCTLYWGEGNIDADPYFKDTGYWGNRDDPNIVVEPNDPNAIWIDGDYHLLGGSPCIDAGDPCYVPEPNETDLDGRPRVIGGRIDMGAYEFFNTPPVADAGDDQVVECACNTAEGTKVTLDGSGSYDVDGDALTYKWTGPFIESPADGAAPTVTLEDGCPGEYVITLVVNDGTEDSEPNEVVITVVDTTPPEFTFSVTPTMLWPPNKKMVMITPSWTLSDNCDSTPEVSLVSVSMNESETRSNGHTGDDIQIGEDGTIYVRAKRNRTGDRIYTITYQAVDDSGNATVRNATVTVPRKRR